MFRLIRRWGYFVVLCSNWFVVDNYTNRCVDLEGKYQNGMFRGWIGTEKGYPINFEFIRAFVFEFIFTAGEMNLVRNPGSFDAFEVLSPTSTLALWTRDGGLQVVLLLERRSAKTESSSLATWLVSKPMSTLWDSVALVGFCCSYVGIDHR